MTSVGGTQLPAGANARESGVEVGWATNIPYSSSGGFSNYYPMPDYQNKSVSAYIANPMLKASSYSGLTTSSGYRAFANNTDGNFNRAGRAYPDVSALTYNIAVSSINRLL